MQSLFALLAALLCGASALRVPQPALRRSPAPLMSVEESAVSEEMPVAEMDGKVVPTKTIFTMQDRDDGWNDVREGIREEIKQRERPLKDVQENYVQPVAKWSKVLWEEFGPELPDLPDLSDLAAASNKEKLPPAKNIGETLARAATPFLDVAVAKREREQAEALAKIEAAKEAERKIAAKRNPVAAAAGGAAAGASGLALIAVPVTTLAVLYALSTGAI